MHRRPSLRLAFLWLVACSLLAPGIAAAQQTFSVLVDRDNSDATGCTVGTAPEQFLGADFELVTTVDTTQDPPQVTDLALNQCTAAPSTWAPFAGPDPFAQFTPPWDAPELSPGGQLDAIETYLPLSAVNPGTTVQLGAFAGPRSDPQDVLFGTGPGAVNPILLSLPLSEIPTLAEWSMLLLALLLLTSGVVALRRRASRAGLMLGVLLISGGLGIAVASAPHAADGIILDWTGHSPAATDPIGDGAFNQDIGQGFVHVEGGTAFFRIDAVLTGQAPFAVDDTFPVNEDSGANQLDVRANDTDPPPPPSFEIIAVTQPANGTVAITNGGADVSYTPNANYCNNPPGTTPDTFTYSIGPNPPGTIAISTATVSVTVNCVDDPPTAVNDSATVGEDAPATTIDVQANDTDIDAGPSSITSVTQPANGTVVITNGGADLTYQPDADYCNDPPGTTPDTFTYTLTPGGSTATVSVTVTCGDDPPVAVDDAATVGEDAPATAVDVLTNDTDADGGPKTIGSVTQPANGTVVITGGGTGLTYQPDADYCNDPPGTTPDTFTYTLAQGGPTPTATVSMTVTCADDNPVANDDTVTVAEDDPATAVDVLANDTDADSDPFTITSVTQPANGAVVITGGGTGLTYEPNDDYCNTPPGTTLDTFTYTLTPGGDTATVTVTVTCVDDPPVAVDDAATVAEDAAATPVPVLANDTDIDAGPISIASVTQPANGTVVITGGGTGLTYQPNSGYCNNPPGTTLDTFTYTLTPGGDTATVTMTVTCVDDPPVAVNDPATVDEDSGASAIDVLANDTDTDGGPIAVDSVTQPANGAVVITGGGTGLTYQPNADYCNNPPGSPLDTFTYTLAPGGSVGTVSVTVTCINDGPRIDLDANDDKGTGGADFAVTFTEGDLATLIEDPADATLVDVDGATVDSLTVTLTNLLDDGFETLDADISGLPGLTKDYDTTTTPGVGVLTISGTETEANYETVLRTVTYVNTDNAPDTSAARTVNFVASDGTTSGNTAVSTVTVVAVDTDPTAVDDSATVNEDSGANAIDVLANDTDPDGGPISVTSVTQPANGTVVITGGGTGLTYQPNSNYCNNPPGTTLDTFTYTLTPGGDSATVTVTVTCVDDNPTAVNDSATVNEDSGANTINVQANDTDPDGGTNTITSVTQPANGTVAITNAGADLTYAPNANYCNNPPGTTLDTFTYTLDPGASVATVTVTVTCVDDAPVAVADAATVVEDSGANAVDVLANDTDLDGGAISITSVTQPANGAVVITGGGTGLTYAPNLNYCNNPPGTTLDTFTYTLTPGGSSTTVTMTVTCVDDPPVAVNDAATVLEDSGANNVPVLANDTDPDAGPISITSVTQPANGAVVITGGGTGLTYAPNLNYCNNPPGTTLDTFTYTLTPASATPTATVTMTVTCVNDPPVPTTNPVSYTTAGNTQLHVEGKVLAGVVSTSDGQGIDEKAGPFADPDGPLAASIVDASGSSANGGSFDIDTNGSFTYVPPVNFNGTDSFTYQVTDGTDATSATVNVTVSEMVWYVHDVTGANNPAASDTGLSNNAFEVLQDAINAAGQDDIVFVFRGNTGTTAHAPATITNKDGLKLHGQGIGLTVTGFGQLVAPGGEPNEAVVSNAAVTAGEDNGIQVTINSGTIDNAEIRGLAFTGTDNGIDVTVTGSAVAGLTISNNEIGSGTPGGVDINHGSTGISTFAVNDNLLSTGGTAIDIARTAGTVRISAFDDNQVSGDNTGAGIVVAGPVTFDSNPGTAALDAVSGGNTIIGQPGNPVGGAGMSLGTVTGSLVFTDLDIFAATSGLTVVGTGAFTGAAGTNVQVTPAAPDGAGTGTIDADNGAAVDITSATIDLRLDDLDSNTSASGVTLTTVAGQLKTDADASITKSSGAGTAFSVGSSSLTVDYAGTLGVTSGSGVSLSSNSGTTTFRGGMTLSTGANTAFSASGGGTVNVIDPAGVANNTVTTTTATAVTISGTTIGASGVTFESVNSATASSNTAIVLANTGAGAFSVTGTGGGGSGGTIDNKTIDAVTLNNTDGLVTLNNMIIEDIGTTAGGFDVISNHDAIHGQQIDGGLSLTNTTIRRISDAAIHGATLAGNAATVWNGLTIANSLIENTNRWHVAGTADDNNEGMIRILGIRGTVSITNSTLQDGAEMLDFFVTGGTLNMTATANNFNRAYKEFTSGPLASQGGHCVDVTVQGASNATIVIGDRNNDALDNNFLNCRLASARVAADATATGTINVTVGRNDFTVNDHSSGFGGDFDFPQGGLALTSQPTTPDTLVFNAVVDGNYFDEIANASGGVGQLTLAMANGTWQVLVQNNTFDTPGNAPWFARADSTSSARVKFQNNVGIKGFFNCPDPSCAGGFNGPGLRSLVDLQNGAIADVTIIADQFAEHDAGFDPGQTFEARVLNTGGGGTLCLDLQNNQAPDGYSIEEFAGDFNLVGSGTCAPGSPSVTCSNLLGARGNRGGANVATTNPPFVNVENPTIDVVAAACLQPSGGIF